VRIGRIVGVVLVLVGVVWFFQGLDVIKGSFMTGHLVWTFFGALLIIGGGSLMRGPRRQ
jgi:hypothetical protein